MFTCHFSRVGIYDGTEKFLRTLCFVNESALDIEYSQ